MNFINIILLGIRGLVLTRNIQCIITYIVYLFVFSIQAGIKHKIINYIRNSIGILWIKINLLTLFIILYIYNTTIYIESNHYKYSFSLPPYSKIHL